MNNRLRETAVTVAVWASSQHAIAEVWFAGPRTVGAQGSHEMLEIVIVMTDHAHQVEARSVGRQVSQLSWEDDIRRAVRGPHTIKTLSAGTAISDGKAVRIFSRDAEAASDIVCPPQRKQAAQSPNSYTAGASGEIGNVRPL